VICEHIWRRVYEEFLLGGTFPVGWECKRCGEFIEQGKVTPAGLSGQVLHQEGRLIGPHGARGQCADGSSYKEQIVDSEGTLHIIR
jgi:hypothetical protein